MEKYTIFEFTPETLPTPIVGIVVNVLDCGFNEDNNCSYSRYLCYSQNRLFVYDETIDYVGGNNYIDEFGNIVTGHQEVVTNYSIDKVLVDYCIIPEYDTLLENYCNTHAMVDSEV